MSENYDIPAPLPRAVPDPYNHAEPRVDISRFHRSDPHHRLSTNVRIECAAMRTLTYAGDGRPMTRTDTSR
jgi:hypothetical protein